MSKRKETSVAIDYLLSGLAMGTITATILIAPNAIQILEKPLEKLMSHLDERHKKRELSKLLSYLKTQGLVRGSYDHGIELTRKGMKRVNKFQIKSLEVLNPEKWDRKWRILMFDIPESKRDNRSGFVKRLQLLGFQLLQQSVWVHPFQCREEVSVIAQYYSVLEWVTYIETSHIDNSVELEKRFKLTGYSLNS